MTGANGHSILFPVALEAGLAMLGGGDVITAFRGGDLRGHFWPAAPRVANEVAILCPGFTEFCEKHGATCRALHERGYDVLVIDWPGQGRSGHFGRDPLAVHVDDFSDYLAAMDAVLAAAGLDQRDCLLMGHSMGGHLALRLAEHYAGGVKAVILSAPMILPPVTPAFAVRMMAGLLCHLGWARSYPPFHRTPPLSAVRQFQHGNVLTSWQPGYEAQFLWMDDAPTLRRSGPTIGWVAAAYASCAATTMNPNWMRRITVPVLALTAADERVVDKSATDQMLPFLPSLEHHELACARHEIMQETPEILATAWAHIDGFLARL